MIAAAEYPLRSSLPFLRDNSVMYLSSGKYPVTDRYIFSSYREIFGTMLRSGFKYVYLPEMLSELSPEIMGYLFPGAFPSDAGSIQEAVQTRLFGGQPKDGFLRSSSGSLYFYELNGGNDPSISLYDYLRGIAATVEELRFSRGRIDHAIRRAGVVSPYVTYECDVKPVPYGLDAVCDEAKPSEDGLDAAARAILTEIDRIQEMYGITIEELEAILKFKVKLSRLRVTHSGGIFLPDFDNREVKMDHLSKAVYFLYLQHPEGITYFDLVDHKAELKDLYLRITGREDEKAIDKSISDLVNRYDNSINVKVSRVRAAFRSAVGDRVAKHYYIDGPQGGVKTIPLDRSNVIWEL